jgi:hypothetical protein
MVCDSPFLQSANRTGRRRTPVSRKPRVRTGRPIQTSDSDVNCTGAAPALPLLPGIVKAPEAM